MCTKISLILTGSTLEEDLKMFAHYQQTYPSVQMLELRVDHLNHNEVFQVYKFPSLVNLPVILTIRRKSDGGEFYSGEYSRLLTFFHCLNADALTSTLSSAKTFEYIDLEDDFHSPELEEVCESLNIKIIRSHHSINTPIQDYDTVLKSLRLQKHDIIKIASYSSSLKDTQKLFEVSKTLEHEDHVLISLGKYGLPSRILASRLGSKWVYTLTANSKTEKMCEDKMLTPEDLVHDTYNFHNIHKDSQLFGIIGSSVNNSLSLAFHNQFFAKHNMDYAYIPLSAKTIEEALEISQYLGIKGLSVTAPFKIQAMQYANKIDESARATGSCNTLTFFGESFYEDVKAYNTDILGFEKALQFFLKQELTPSLRISVLGAGGVARAVCYVLHKLDLKEVVIFNRTHAKACQLAGQFNFDSCVLDASAIQTLREHSQLIINATSVGGLSLPDDDVLPFYRFIGNEKVFDLAYRSSTRACLETPLIEKAKHHGCATENAYAMFHHQAMEQIKIFYQHPCR